MPRKQIDPRRQFFEDVSHLGGNGATDSMSCYVRDDLFLLFFRTWAGGSERLLRVAVSTVVGAAANVARGHAATREQPRAERCQVHR